MNHTILVGAGLLAMSAATAFAADLPVKARPVVPVAPTVYNWTGIYSATSVGGQWWRIRGDYINTGTPDHHNTSGSRFISGSHIGAQYQFGSWVIGVEGAYNTGFNPSYTASNSISADCLGAFPVANRTCESRIRNYWTAGGKLGYAWNNWMVYGIGGYANGRIDTQTFVTTTGILTSQTTDRHSGWFVGAGVDVFVTKLWLTDLIVGLEYTHVELGGRTHIDDLDTSVPASARVNNRNMKASDDVFRVKITSKLNWDGPVVAKY